MAREFFTGGLMPSVALLRTSRTTSGSTTSGSSPGTHYARTAEAWYANLMAHRRELEALVGRRAFQRWRVFFLACAELFGYARGTEWLVAHYRFGHP